MVDCMFENVYTEGQLVIREGEPGNYLYVLSEGLLEVIQNGKLLGEMHAGTAFGELAILYNCKRTATVKALSEAHIWALDRQMFQTIMRQTTQARHEEYFSFLRSLCLEKVPVLWKRSCEILVPKTADIEDPYHYRPVTLVPDLMKPVERIIFSHLRWDSYHEEVAMHPLQFA
eukprot:XP_011618673.1 PREDICTED: cGMP-dependent protein kinase 2-like [Takifugu rubripes]